MRGCHKQYVMGRDCTEAIIEPIMAGRTNRFLLQRHCPWDGLCETSGVECLGIRGTAWNDWNVQFLRRSTRQEVLIGWSLKDCNWQSTWLSEIATMSSISWRGWRVQDIERASLYPAISSYCIICFNIFHPNWKVKQARHPSLPSGSSGHTTRCTLGPAEVHSQSQTCRRSAPWRNAMPRSADMYDMSDMYEVGHGWPLMCFPLL